MTDKLQGIDGTGELVYSYQGEQQYRVLYWKVSREFLGNRLAAYGGFLTATQVMKIFQRTHSETTIIQRFTTQSGNSLGTSLADSDIIMMGNGLSLHYSGQWERVAGVQTTHR